MKRVVITVFSLFYLLISVYIPSVYGKTYQFGRYTRINDIYVSAGKIWIATDNGIYQVTKDGYIITAIDTDYGLPDLYVKKLIVDGKGRIFALTSVGLSVIYTHKKVSQNFSDHEGLPMGAYQALAISSNYVVVASSEYLWVLNMQTGKRYTARVSSYINDVKIVDDKIYVAAYDGLYEYTNRATFARSILNFRSNNITRYGDYLYVATDKGIYKIHIPGLAVSKVNELGVSSDVRQVIFSGMGDLVAVYGNEIMVKPINGKSYKLSIGVTGNVITAAASYGKQNILVALVGEKNAGLYIIDNMFYVRQLIGIDAPVRNNVVSYIKPENMSVVWFKYGEELYWFSSPGRFYHFKFMSADRKPIDSSIILSISPWITGDKLALGTVLGFYVGNKISRVMSQVDISSFISESIVDVDTDGKGNYFILTRKYLYVYNAYTGYFKRLLLPKGEYAYDEFYYDGGIYIATTKSILKYVDNVIVAYHSLDYGATHIVGTLGGIWTISDGKLIFLDRRLKKIVPIKIFDKLNVVDIDSWQHYLVVATDKGVFLYKGGKIWGVYTAEGGMLSSNLVTSIAVWNEYLVVGTRSGLSVISMNEKYIPFRDVRTLSDVQWLSHMVALGIVKGTTDGSLMLYKPITNEQLVVLLARTFNISSSTCKVNNAHVWAVPYICGYFKGNVPKDVNWKEPLSQDLLSKYFSFLVIPSRGGRYLRIDVFRFLYSLIYSSGLWR